MKKVKISLKKIFSNKSNLEFFNLICEKIGSDFSVYDNKGKEVYSHKSEKKEFTFKKEIIFNDEIIGYIKSNNKNDLSFIEHLIIFIIHSEIEKKELTQETLRRYRELALLYKFNEKLVSTFDKYKIAQISINEIKKIIIADEIFLILIDEGEFKVISDKEVSEELSQIPEKNYHIINEVLTSNEPQIFNDYPFKKDKKISMMCAPLKVKDKDIGVIIVTSYENYFYTSEDIKLLSAIATQTGYAIENAILHEKQLEEERLRSNFGRLYIVTVIIFSAVTLMPDTSNYPAKLQMALSWGCLFSILIPLYIMVRKMNMPLSFFGVTLQNTKKSIIEGLIFSVILIPTVILYKKLTAPHEPLITWRTMKNYDQYEFWFYILTYSIHSYLQEFIARGVIQGSLLMFMKDQHYLIPIVLTASIFGIAHIHISYSAAISTFAISFIFGYIYYRHQNLIGVAIVHYVLGILAIAVGLI